MRDSIAAARTGEMLKNPDGSAALDFCFSKVDPTFTGHFPTRPLLPGVYQLEMTRVAAEVFLDCPLTVREIIKAKFLRPMVPGESIRLELKLAEQVGTIQARAGFFVNGQPAGETIMQLTRNP